MQRLKDYAGFGMWFVGLGYIGMWLVAGPLNWPLGRHASALCATPSVTPLCALAHAQTLPPVAHLVGLLAAITVLVRLLLIAIRSARGDKANANAAPSSTQRRRKPQSTVVKLKARDHFGLRGLDR